ncbi:MAG: hypothetical protein JO370_12070 [Paucibacter sp.]|nr:hypothetical protein [Roseateles sp.]
MDLLTTRFPPFAFPAFFVCLWFGATTLLGALSGWYGLMKRFPDQPEPPLLLLRQQTGSLGLVAMNRILVLSVCPSGLRVGMMRLFGPFCRDFFVPWNEITAQRKTSWLGRRVVLVFARESGSKLSIPDHVANRLASAAAGRWPEDGTFEEEAGPAVAARILKQWLAQTTLAAAFFIIAPRVMATAAPWPPVALAVLFPAIVFGIGALIQYVRRQER